MSDIEEQFHIQNNNTHDFMSRDCAMRKGTRLIISKTAPRKTVPRWMLAIIGTDDMQEVFFSNAEMREIIATLNQMLD